MSKPDLPFAEFHPLEHVRAFLEHVAADPTSKFKTSYHTVERKQLDGVSAEAREIIDWFGGTEFQWRLSDEHAGGMHVVSWKWRKGSEDYTGFSEGTVWRQLDTASPESPIYLIHGGTARHVYAGALAEEMEGHWIGSAHDYLRRGVAASFMSHWARKPDVPAEDLAVARARWGELFDRPGAKVTLRSREPTEEGWEKVELRVAERIEYVDAPDVLSWLADAAPATFAPLFDVRALKFGNRAWRADDLARDTSRKLSGTATIVSAEVPSMLVGVAPGTAWAQQGIYAARFRWTTRKQLLLTPMRPGTALAKLVAARAPYKAPRLKPKRKARPKAKAKAKA